MFYLGALEPEPLFYIGGSNEELVNEYLGCEDEMRTL